METRLERQMDSVAMVVQEAFHCVVGFEDAGKFDQVTRLGLLR